MRGLILCGGRSSRMGSDKGLLRHQGKTWASIAMDKFSSLGLHVSISISANQVPAYHALFENEILSIDSPELAVKGRYLEF